MQASWGWSLLAVPAALVAACGGSQDLNLPGESGGVGGVLSTGGSSGASASGGVAGSGASGGTTAGSSGSGGSGATGGGATDAGKPDGFIDPECPDAEPPPVTRECEPFERPTGCGPGEGCYPFVEYPASECSPERYGTFCQPAGSGQQGDPCEQGQGCGAGFVCVVTGQGTQCVQLCPLTGDDRCPRGLICEPVDVEGFGGCF
jgi:hypothetical protein